MSPSDTTTQVIFVDVLFLCVAGGLAFWFRAWLGEQQKGMDRRLQALEEQQQVLGRICERLTAACRGLERPSPAVDALARSTPKAERTPAVRRQPVTDIPMGSTTDTVPAAMPAAVEARDARPAPAAARQRIDTPAAHSDRKWEEQTDRSREAYRRARDLLEQGVPVNDIARQVGLGVAEVNVLKRMRDAGRR